MKVLDLFCGGGGACEGYQRAGCSVTGIDLVNTKNYPGVFINGDVLKMIGIAREFDFIHASPPCQAYSSHVTSDNSPWNHTRGKSEPALIDTVRELLLATQKPFVIENVVGARKFMREPVLLCGSMFNLPISRHRLFVCHGFKLVPPAHLPCRGIAKIYAERHGIDYRDMSVTGKGRRAGCAQRWATFLGVNHPMTQHELSESIPPAYTEYIARAFFLANP